MRRYTIHLLVSILLLAAAGTASAQRPACAADNAGLTVPAGFCVTIFADTVRGARHLVVAPNGDVFVATRNSRALMRVRSRTVSRLHPESIRVWSWTHGPASGSSMAARKIRSRSSRSGLRRACVTPSRFISRRTAGCMAFSTAGTTCRRTGLHILTRRRVLRSLLKSWSGSPRKMITAGRTAITTRI
jgi:glucose/arabinose dehydrogenase